jgi:hypothetical protein
MVPGTARAEVPQGAPGTRQGLDDRMTVETHRTMQARHLAAWDRVYLTLPDVGEVLATVTAVSDTLDSDVDVMAVYAAHRGVGYQVHLPIRAHVRVEV